MPLRTGPAGRHLVDVTPDLIEAGDSLRLARRSLEVAPERPIPAVASCRCDAGTLADSRIGCWARRARTEVRGWHSAFTRRLGRCSKLMAQPAMYERPVRNVF
jgi:hypothetical protein